MEIIFINTKNSKTNKPHKFVFKFLQTLGLKISSKHITLQNLYIYYTRKDIRQ